MPRDFSAWYRACPAKNWPEVQEVKEVNAVKEEKENASNII
jgi:hypothetical protein